MALGTRQKRQRQEELWVATTTLARPASHPFYERPNRLLDESGFDEFVEQLCQPFYAETMGRPGLVPGIYFRLLLVGYFEGIDSERGIAWRAADSLGIRSFLRIALDETAPDHSTISRTRRLMDLETHRRYSPGFWRCWPSRVCCEARRWVLMRPRWRRTRRYGALCDATAEKRTMIS